MNEASPREWVRVFPPGRSKEDELIPTIPGLTDGNRLALESGQRSEYNEAALKVTKEGSRWIALGYPGKRWRSLEQAISYTVNQRES